MFCKFHQLTWSGKDGMSSIGVFADLFIPSVSLFIYSPQLCTATWKMRSSDDDGFDVVLP